MKQGRRLVDLLRPLFSFSRSERRGILWLLPLLAILSVLILFSNRPSFEESFTDLADVRAAASGGSSQGGMRKGGGTIDSSAERRFADEFSSRGGENSVVPAAELFPFDPNTVTFAELCRLGLDKRTAAGIVKYRAKGKRFEIPEDFATCYGVSLADFERLEPCIAIGERYRLPRAGSIREKRGEGPAGATFRDRRGNGFPDDRGRADSMEARPVRNGDSLFRFDPNTLPAEGFVRLGFSVRQADVIVRYRESRGGFRSPDDLATCYVVSERKFEALRPYIVIAVPAPKTPPMPELIELNTADSAALRTVHGIGAVLVTRILAYRDRLGGFVRKEQLSEIPGMTEANYERICPQIYVDSCIIRKIDINFASPKELLRRLDGHPYLSAATLRRILKYRQLKGGWSAVGEMTKEHVLTQEQAARLAPYLSFRTVK